MAKPRMAGSDEFKEELSKADQHAAARERMASSEEGINARLEGVSGIDGLDRANVVRAMQGGSFGEKDLARYNKLMGIEDSPTETDTPVISEPVADNTNPAPANGPGTITNSRIGNDSSVTIGNSGNIGNPSDNIGAPVVPIGGQVIGGNTGDIGKVGDMTTTIGDGNTITGSSIGNDNSVTIGNTGNMGSSGAYLANALNSLKKANSGGLYQGLQFS